jgi:hypothetical protein
MEHLGGGAALGGVGVDAGARRRSGGNGGARNVARGDALWRRGVAGAVFKLIFLKIFKHNWTK